MPFKLGHIHSKSRRLSCSEAFGQAARSLPNYLSGKGASARTFKGTERCGLSRFSLPTQQGPFLKTIAPFAPIGGAGIKWTGLNVLTVLCRVSAVLISGERLERAQLGGHSADRGILQNF